VNWPDVTAEAHFLALLNNIFSPATAIDNDGFGLKKPQQFWQSFTPPEAATNHG
jgi:hypothetical protein